MTLFSELLLFLCTLLFGSVVGAYFTTADYRIRNNLPLITSQCYCPACGHVLALTHQIPVISWFLLSGKCHYCKESIPVRYPLTEGGFLLFYGITFLLLWDRYPAAMLCLWLGLATFLILLRCKKHYYRAICGILIFTGYHVIYGALLMMIHASA